jgi:hypothetical protein
LFETCKYDVEFTNGLHKQYQVMWLPRICMHRSMMRDNSTRFWTKLLATAKTIQPYQYHMGWFVAWMAN